MSKPLDHILGDLKLNAEGTERVKAVTFWIPLEYKASYDRLQKMSARQFGKKARETLLALITLAEQRAS